MAINPSEITTVRASELPPSSPTDASVLVHEVGGILSRMTVLELIYYIKTQATSYQYEVKLIRAPNETYITDNFDMLPSATQGLGKVGGLWEGWAICNGNNGTDNLDGQTFIGYGANYSTVGQFLGSPDAVLIDHSHTVPKAANDTDGNTLSPGNGNLGTVNTSSVGSTVGEDGVNKSYQPSMVILKIMKL